ncbi:helix-turn-helix domain-containing protein [Sellimonas intestinalis]|uniref:helix-turn-helix domain-containing protein n=1 Tax=Sellimonas intestinalis TaxID=1653434 RepID=UPI0015ECBEAF|nr:helix-turn-helix transcriptional regulator [Sellimonas intestinalis]
MCQKIDYAKLGIKIKELRLHRGYTQDSLAEAVGCNTSHISNIENNHTKVSLNVLFGIANVLDTSIDYLLSNQYRNTKLALDNELDRAIRKCSIEQKEKLLKIIEIL